MLYAHVETIELAQASSRRRRSALRTTPAKSRRAAASRFMCEPFQDLCCGQSGEQGRCRGRAASCSRQRYSSRPKEGANVRGTAVRDKRQKRRRRGASPPRARRRAGCERGRRERRRRGASPPRISSGYRLTPSPVSVAPGLAFFLKDLFERGQELGRRRGVAVFVVASPVELLRDPRDHREVAVTGEGSLGAARPPEQVEGDRGLIRKQAEELHLSEGE